jgi:hypothetical protein
MSNWYNFAAWFVLLIVVSKPSHTYLLALHTKLTAHEQGKMTVHKCEVRIN